LRLTIDGNIGPITMGRQIDFFWDVSQDDPSKLYQGRVAAQLELERLIKRLNQLKDQKSQLEEQLAGIEKEIETVEARIEELQKSDGNEAHRGLNKRRRRPWHERRHKGGDEVRHLQGLEVIGIRRGFEGLLEGDVIPLTSRSVGGIIHRAAPSFAPPKRTLQEAEGQVEALDRLKELDLDGLILIGGEGTFKGAWALSERDFPSQEFRGP